MNSRYLTIIIVHDKNGKRSYIKISDRTDSENLTMSAIDDNISLVDDFNMATIFDCADPDIDLSLEHIRNKGYYARTIKINTLMFDSPETNYNVGYTRLAENGVE